MAEFRVWFTREITESVAITVTASSETDASRLAMHRLWNDETPPEWEIDDAYHGDAYVSSIEPA